MIASSPSGSHSRSRSVRRYQGFPIYRAGTLSRQTKPPSTIILMLRANFGGKVEKPEGFLSVSTSAICRLLRSRKLSHALLNCVLKRKRSYIPVAPERTLPTMGLALVPPKDISASARPIPPEADNVPTGLLSDTEVAIPAAPPPYATMLSIA